MSSGAPIPATYSDLEVANYKTRGGNAYDTGTSHAQGPFQGFQDVTLQGKQRGYKICGLTSHVFIALLATCMFVLGGAIGGGVGGGIAASRSSNKSVAAAQGTSAKTVSFTATVTNTATPTRPAFYSSATAFSSACSQGQTITPSNPAIRDYPFSINGTSLIYQIYCDANILGGDMQEIYNLTSLNDCITACGVYNYQLPTVAGFDGYSQAPLYDELCSGVAFGFQPEAGSSPTRCFLKQGVSEGTAVVEGTLVHVAKLISSF